MYSVLVIGIALTQLVNGYEQKTPYGDFSESEELSCTFSCN
jgi:hypothetical protein